jgi:hypothetical protein
MLIPADEKVYSIQHGVIVSGLWQVMVNNSTNINKANNYVSPQITDQEKATTYPDGHPSAG